MASLILYTEDENHADNTQSTTNEQHATIVDVAPPTGRELWQAGVPYSLNGEVIQEYTWLGPGGQGDEYSEEEAQATEENADVPVAEKYEFGFAATEGSNAQLRKVVKHRPMTADEQEAAINQIYAAIQKFEESKAAAAKAHPVVSSGTTVKKLPPQVQSMPNIEPPSTPQARPGKRQRKSASTMTPTPSPSNRANSEKANSGHKSVTPQSKHQRRLAIENKQAQILTRQTLLSQLQSHEHLTTFVKLAEEVLSKQENAEVRSSSTWSFIRGVYIRVVLC